MKRYVILILTTLLVLLLSGALAHNVDLVTLPSRESVQLTIYNSEDLTLVRETRYITVKRGANRLQFSWSGTLIDPTSLDFRPLAHADAIDLAEKTGGRGSPTSGNKPFTMSLSTRISR